MSEGFSAGWLELRERYDAAARSPAVRNRLVAWAAGRADGLRVVDLGSGTGSNLRYLAPHLGRQSWTLVELDPALIEAGERRLGRREVEWRYLRLDLAAELERVAELRPQLITGSAILDLVSQAWIERLVALAGTTGAALCFALSYDGRVEWSPEASGDRLAIDLVNAHQRTDKGFGPALGPQAVLAMRRALAPLAGDLVIESSDWQLGGEDREIQAALLEGYVGAAKAMAPAEAATLDAWAEERLAHLSQGRSRLAVGHLDLLFLPA